MAYAAVISLTNTLNRLLYYSPPDSISSRCRNLLQSAHSSKKILNRLQSSVSDSSIRESGVRRSRSAINAVNDEIREAATRLEDLLDTLLSEQIRIAQSSENSTGDGLEEVLKQECFSLRDTVKKMKKEYNRIKQGLVEEEEEDEDEEEEEEEEDDDDDEEEEEEDDDDDEEEEEEDDDDDEEEEEEEEDEEEEDEDEEEDDDDGTAFEFGGNKSTGDMVGLSNEFNEIKDLLMNDNKFQETYEIVGMAGIGKTALARRIFEDPSVRNHFQRRAFVTVGQKYRREEILQAVVSQLNPDIREGTSTTKRRPRRSSHGNKRYLIVVDDIWGGEEGWYRLEMESYFPDNEKGSRFLVTTRQKKINVITMVDDFRTHRMRFLNKEESVFLLREKVFGKDELFPDPQLEKAAERIVEICEGLPLAIIAVADLLSKAKNHTPEYWNEMADKGISIFNYVSDDMMKVLILSYNYLPQYLKACFLYMGVFPPKCEIPVSKLANMWFAERLHRMDMVNPEKYAKDCLERLASESDLIMVRQKSLKRSRIKTCGVHAVYWHLCNIEAGKEKFFHVINSNAESSAEDIKGQRRLCSHNNVLFGIQEVTDAMESSAATTRSILCTGPYHPYPLPQICFGSSLLKVLDLLTIRFYNFPIEVVDLIHLKYLALTYSGKIPASISKLWNLEYLIVHQHLRIINSGAQSVLPIEIWNMRRLRLLQVMGSKLPYHDGDALLPNLLTLSYMSADSCTKEILKKTPNLKKLGIQIELAADNIATAADHLFRCFDHLADHLHELESLTCEVVNPNPISQVVAFPASFPSSLKSLSLSGLGYPWEYMTTVAILPNLQVLKLQCCAFRGPKWEIREEDFPKLESLLLEDLDLEYMEGNPDDHGCLYRLARLTIRHCYSLKKIPTDTYTFRFNTLKLIDCPLAVAHVETIKKHMKSFRGEMEKIVIHVESSWDEKKSKK